MAVVIAHPSTARRAAAFAALFVAYQLPEGLGLRLLRSEATNGGLMLAFFPIAWAAGRWLLGGAGEAYRLAPRRSAAGALLLLLLVALAAKAAAVAAGAALGIYRVAAPAPAPPGRLALAVLAALPMTFIPSLAEDIVTRGFWHGALPPAWRAPLRFAPLSAAIFTLNHIYRLGEGPAEWGLLLCFGLAYGAALARGGTLYAALGLHWGWNLANALLPLWASVAVERAALARLPSAAAHLLELALVVTLPAALLGAERGRAP